MLEASVVCSESVLISSATTANPFPASPALAASIDALSARRFVWLAILRIVPTKASTSPTLFVRLAIVSTVVLLVLSTFSACSLS